MNKTQQIDAGRLKALVNLTLPQVLAVQAEYLGDRHVAIREKAYGIWQRYTWKEYLSHVRHVSLALKALGLKRNDIAAIIMDNHPEWLFSELGAQALGAVTLNLFTSAVASELIQALVRIRTPLVIAQDQEQVDKLLDQKDKLPFVKTIVYVDPTGMGSYRDNTLLMSFRELLELGQRREREHPGLFEQELGKGRADETALMIMTSGTTGVSKLAMLTHRNFTSMARQWLMTVPIGVGSDWMSMSPPAWIVDQMWGVGVTLAGGMTMNFPETPETVQQDFREIGPSILITSSRFWEDLASKIRVKIDDAGFVNRAFFSLAEKIGSAVIRYEAERRPVPAVLRALNLLASFAVFKPLLDRVGCSRFISAYTGGHPISPDVIRFFRSVGLNLKQCYGLTETCGIFQIQPDDEVKLETVGKPLPGTQVRISEDQEVLVSSDTVFAGYHDDFEATEAAFEQGWLRTGDAGYLDDDGHLIIIGRKQDIIRDKHGNAFSPDFIETRLKFSLFIKEAVIFGEGRPFITALINIDMGNVGNWAEERMIPYTTYTDLSQQPRVERLIFEEVQEVNAQLPPPMRIRKFILLYKLLDADDEELTRTGKVRRRFVYGLYLPMIEAMYGGKDEIEVQGKVRYRDGQVGMIQTTARIISVE
ncbi:MAG TPA: AMP-binding protein [Deltaproteobacteria bacterium]|jgi:long-chain acyl-CoA synthetase|nr:AMP-binding protein [Deltaproteobacteria bacterium]MDI9541915.1 AMP-binding protein [Pseudomonadota bacterium]HNR51192.1 AMP-binding protein [Deltaproteobacteria bacterium]HOD72277.1 AMP-binding protein [Deltaproteobacteria bacterium]HON60883.1 AMP-binding protein [Deltaproteobacteria bacterium]